MKVKCIKDTIGYKSGQIYESDRAESHITTFVNGTEYQYCWKQLPEYFQEEKPSQALPRWKIGDYVVRKYKNQIDFSFVTGISRWENGEIYVYTEFTNEPISIENYRSPTREELSIYYK